MLGFLDQETSALFVCDFQSYYSPSLKFQYEDFLTNNKSLIRVCEELNIPIIFTQHKGYGELEERLNAGKHKIFEKTKYSMWDNNLKSYIKEKYPNLKSILITGFETHVCLYQTAMDLIKEGYETHIITDASSSVNEFENRAALKRVKQMGTFLISTEMAILQFIKDETHPFSEIAYKINSDRLDELKNNRSLQDNRQ